MTIGMLQAALLRGNALAAEKYVQHARVLANNRMAGRQYRQQMEREAMEAAETEQKQADSDNRSGSVIHAAAAATQVGSAHAHAHAHAVVLDSAPVALIPSPSRIPSCSVPTSIRSNPDDSYLGAISGSHLQPVSIGTAVRLGGSHDSTQGSNAVPTLPTCIQMHVPVSIPSCIVAPVHVRTGPILHPSRFGIVQHGIIRQHDDTSHSTTPGTGTDANSESIRIRTPIRIPIPIRPASNGVPLVPVAPCNGQNTRTGTTSTCTGIGSPTSEQAALALLASVRVAQEFHRTRPYLYLHPSQHTDAALHPVRDGNVLYTCQIMIQVMSAVYR